MRRCSEVVEAARPISSTISQPIQVRRRSSVSTTFTRAGWPSALARAAIRSRSKATVAFADGAAGFRADFTAMSYILRYSSNDEYNIGPVCCKRSEEHTSELQSLMRISYAVFCLKKKKQHLYKLKNKD